jgi:hypothetical protein
MSFYLSVHDIHWGNPPYVDPRYAEAAWIEGVNWVEFASDVGSGHVMITTAHPEPDGFQRQLITAESLQRLVRDVRLLSPNETHIPRLLPLSTPGDYQVVGEIQVIVRTDDTLGRTSVEVIVGSGWFTLGTDEVSESVVEGDWISFTAVGLIFCDENT